MAQRRAVTPGGPEADPTRSSGDFWRDQGYIRREGTGPEYPYFYVREDDPGYGYLPDYDDPRNAPRRYKLEDLYWMVGVRPPDTDQKEWAQPQQPKEMAATALSGPIAVVYGIDRIGGSMIDLVPGSWFPPGKGQYVTGVAAAYGLGHGEIDSVLKTEYGIEGFAPVAPFNGAQGIWQKIFTGTAAQAADATLTGLHQARGDGAVGLPYPNFAYALELVEWLGDDGPLSNNFIKPIYTIKGKKLLDPRLGLSGAGLPNAPAAWSDQGVLALADYLSDVKYGLRAGLGGIDWASVIDSANYADETVGSSSVTKVVVNNPDEIPPFVSSNLYYGTAGGPPTITFSAPPSGVTATGTVVAEPWPSNPSIWIIKKILITNPGSGYVAAPTITISTSAYGGRTINYTVTLGEKRFSFNLALTRQMSKRGIIDMIASHFRGHVLRRRGKFRIVIDRPRASSYTFDSTNARPGSLRREGVGAPNRLIVEYVDPEQDYKVVEAVAETPGVTAGTETVREERVALQGTRAVSMASRLAWYRLNKQLLNLAGNITGTQAIQMKLEPYDRVQSNLSGLTLQDFELRLIGRSIGNEYSYEIGQYDESIYSDALAVVTPKIKSGLPSPLTPPPPPSDPDPGAATGDPMFTAPRQRAFDPSKQTAWANSSGLFTSFSAAEFANVVSGATAFVVPAGDVYGYAQLNAPGGIAPHEAYITIVGTTKPAALEKIQFARSLNGVDWVDTGTPMWQLVSVDVANDRSTWWTRIRDYSDNTLAQHWRVVAWAGRSQAITVTELTLRSITTQQWPYVAKYRLYKGFTGSTFPPVFIEEVAAIPRLYTSDIDLERYVVSSWENVDPMSGSVSGGALTYMEVEPVSPHGIAGARWLYLTVRAYSSGGSGNGLDQDWVPQTRQDLAIAAGSNASLAAMYSTGLLRLTGHGAAADVHGIRATVGADSAGRRLRVENAGSYIVTLKCESASEPTIGYRMISGTNSDYRIEPGEIVDLTYDDARTRWVISHLRGEQVRTLIQGTSNGSLTGGNVQSDIDALLAMKLNTTGFIPWAQVYSQPTTLVGYGITDAITNVNPGTYGGAYIPIAKGGYTGIYFGHRAYLMWQADHQGVYDTTAGAWRWYFSEGTLAAGSVPWARLTNVPTSFASDWSTLASKPAWVANIGDPAGSYSSLTLAFRNGYAGFKIGSSNYHLMFASDGSGGVVNDGVAWVWNFNSAGSLIAGTVPWGSIAGKPSITTPVTYGGLRIDTTTNAWGGFEWRDEDSNIRYFMLRNDQQGAYNGSTWYWRWVGGVLNDGSVPWARLTSLPSWVSNHADGTGTYGNLVQTPRNSYVGLKYAGSHVQFMFAADGSGGIHNETAGVWKWYFDGNGSLVYGSVPWANITGKPTALSQFSNDSGFITAASLSPYAPLASPGLTGTPTAPTAAAGTNTTQIATTAFVLANAGGGDVVDVLTADEDFTSATPANTSLSASLDANGIYAVEAFILWSPPSNNLAINVKMYTNATMASSRMIAGYVSGSSGTDMETQSMQFGNIDISIATGIHSAGSNGYVRFKGVIVKDGSAGSLTVQAASSTGGATVRVQKGSYLKVRKLN